uniref:Jg16966 protein n=1 Tax=Pararge aegeria aegeria TaxID=348720 RepID=A0A8S4RL40_9NEOP|nr:jg16966 [Pararge aegeria aegeria]
MLLAMLAVLDGGVGGRGEHAVTPVPAAARGASRGAIVTREHACAAGPVRERQSLASGLPPRSLARTAQYRTLKETRHRACEYRSALKMVPVSRLTG